MAPNRTPNPCGRLEVICGPMFAGKSEELIRRLRRADYARMRVVAFKHEIDVRRDAANITTHTNTAHAAQPLGNSSTDLKRLAALARCNVDVIGIDEIQFFGLEMVDIIVDLIAQGKRVIVAGLDLDFRAHPFGIIAPLLAAADEVSKLKAICFVCTHEAGLSQRIINGRPAKYADPTVLIGATESYQARCRACFSIDNITARPPVTTQSNG